MANNILDSYLVRLGAVIDQNSWDKFNVTIKGAELLVDSLSVTAVEGFLKVETALTGMFVSAGLGIIALSDKTAMADQQYRLFGMRMLMTKDSARAMQMATDELGASLDEIAYDPELNRRFQYLYEQNMKLGKSLGSNFDHNMISIRDLRMEFKHFGTELEFLASGTVSRLFEKLGFGSGDLETQLRNLSDWFVTQIPGWSERISDDLVPVWKEFITIVHSGGSIVKELGHDFTYAVGVMAGDKNLQTATTDMEQFETAVKDTIGALAKFVNVGLNAAKIAVGVAGPIAAFLSGQEGKAPDFTRHIGKDGKTHFDLWGDGRESKFLDDLANDIENPDSSTSKPKSKSDVSKSSIMTAVKRASQMTGIPEDLIYGQWAFETGNFTNKTANDRNNLGGIKLPGTLESKQYDSLNDFAFDYSKLLGRNFPNASGAQTSEDLVKGLKNGRIGSYFGSDSASDYQSGVERYKKDYDSGNVAPSVKIDTVNIHVPHALPEDQWHTFVKSSMNDLMTSSNNKVMAQTAGGAFQ